MKKKKTKPKGRRGYYVSALHCLKCKDLIYSRTRHDFRKCECGECFVDGGRDYTRIGFTKVEDYVLVRVKLPYVSGKEPKDESRFPY